MKKFFIITFIVFKTNSLVFAQDAIVQNDKNFYFDPIFLYSINSKNIDISKFENGSNIIPGNYLVEIYLNGLKISKENIIFKEITSQISEPCLYSETLKKINFKLERIPSNFAEDLSSNECIDLKKKIPDTKIDFDSNELKLEITIPQLYLNDDPRGYVNPELWDKGISAGYIGYTLNHYSNTSNGKTTQSLFGSTDTGFNLNGWYFRHQGNYVADDNGNDKYQSVNTYLSKDIKSLKSRLVLGELNTNNKLFSTLPFIGAQLFDVDQMLPYSQRGYAPDIRGAAKTNALVTIRQNDRVIYEKVVPPGPFQISDLFPTGYGGNLNVTVTEADGQTQNFNVPYAAVNQLLRPGAHNYNLAVGRINDKNITSKPMLYQASYTKGLSNRLTGYIGTQYSDNYNAFQVGVGVSSFLGAISADVTESRTKLTDDSKTLQGQSYQLSYSKLIQETNSNLTIAAHRYSTSKYMDLLNAIRTIDLLENGQNQDNLWRSKNRFTVSLNQGLPTGWGQIYLTGYLQNYWNNDNSDIQYQAGYSNTYKMVNYNLSAGRVRSSIGHVETNILFSLTMPLGPAEKKHVPSLTANANHNSNGSTGQQLGLFGSLGNEDQYSYGINVRNGNGDQNTSINMNAQYRSPYTTLTGNYSKGQNYNSTSIGLSGTILGWRNGLVMTPYKGETFAIVTAQGMQGAKVGGYTGIKIDSRGNAAVPYLNAYEMNEITIDPKGTSENVELETSSQRVAPHDGAIISLDFKTKTGYPLLIKVNNFGKPLPFGADVFDNVGNNVGSVGQMGQLFARVNKLQGRLTIKWGESSDQQCNIDYKIDSKNSSDLNNIESNCELKGEHE